MITRADKGTSLVILPIEQYDSKIADFISKNDFQTTTKDPTNSFQSQIRKVLNDSTNLIPPETKWRYTNMNPTAPTMKGLIKLHKPEHPNRPVVNWRGAPAYKLLTLFSHKIKLLAPLPNKFNLENTTDLIKRLNDTSILPQFALASLDITKLYTNVPVAETKKTIAKNLEENQTDPKSLQELLNWYDNIAQQNYFTNKEEILIQKDDLAMGAPTSGFDSRIFSTKP